MGPVKACDEYFFFINSPLGHSIIDELASPENKLNKTFDLYSGSEMHLTAAMLPQEIHIGLYLSLVCDESPSTSCQSTGILCKSFSSLFQLPITFVGKQAKRANNTGIHVLHKLEVIVQMWRDQNNEASNTDAKDHDKPSFGSCPTEKSFVPLQILRTTSQGNSLLSFINHALFYPERPAFVY